MWGEGGGWGRGGLSLNHERSAKRGAGSPWISGKMQWRSWGKTAGEAPEAGQLVAETILFFVKRVGIRRSHGLHRKPAKT